MASFLAKVAAPVTAIAVSCSVVSSTCIVASPVAAAESSQTSPSSDYQDPLCTYDVTPVQEAATQNFERIRSAIISDWAEAIKSELPTGGATFEDVRTEVEALGFNEFDWDFAHGAELDFRFYPATNAGEYTAHEQLPLEVDHARYTLGSGGFEYNHLGFSEKAESLLRYDFDALEKATEQLYEAYTDDSVMAFYTECQEKSEADNLRYILTRWSIGIAIAAVIGIVAAIGSGVVKIPHI